jgi:dTDP-4-dehydrorhamnose reductase|tara:strand:+ start:1340 stop:2278 length:939 start_codon:yes stop_codon:yes gene_type:complete
LKKICVVGASGLVGQNLIKKIQEFDIIGTFNNTPVNLENTPVIQLDVTKYESCEQILKFHPDFIINATAISDVDYCEKFKEKAYSVNVSGVKNLVKIAKKLQCKLIQISTDGIFSGRNESYIEDDLPNPVNYYGQTKLESENEVKNLSDHLICRTNLLYGYVSQTKLNKRSNYSKPTNFVLWVLSELNKKNHIKIVNDQLSNPTLVDNLSKIIQLSLKKNLVGVFHTTDLTCISRFEFAKKIATKFGYSESLISPISSNELNQFAIRPSKTCLDCSKIQKNNINLSSIDKSLDILFSTIKKYEPKLIYKEDF